jgi:oxygen-independent coproporphyrinogen-3 oxidase
LTDEKWEKNLNYFFETGIQHLSAYSLTVEPRTALAHLIGKGKLTAVDELQSVRHFERLIQKMEEEGFVHYEISNFGKPGQLALHNTNYWKGVPYLGLGPSAHSFDGKNRGQNPPSNSKFLKALGSGLIPYEQEILTPTDQVNDRILTGLRTMWGISPAELNLDFGVDLLRSKEKEVEKLAAQGWLIWDGKTLSLTKSGMLLADSIASDLFI